MVLLTAINNFRQYRTKKSNALLLEELRCVSVIEECYSSAITGQTMEVERYHAAFPALGANISPAGMEQFHFPGVDTADQRAFELCAHPCLSETQNSNGHHPALSSVKQRSAQVQRSQKQKDRINNSNSNREKNYNHAKRTPKHFLTKPRKSNREKNSVKKVSLSLRTNDAKPWKHLEPVVPEIPAALPEICSPPPPTSAEADLWLSQQVLDIVLATDVHEQAPSQSNLRSLWSDEAVRDKQEETAFWKFVGAAGDTGFLLDQPDCSASSITSGEDISTVTDYELIEQSLASLQFCEDLPEAGGDSKLLPLFRENPFSYMIAQSDSVGRDAGESTSSAEPFSCKHCQEAYEVVLDLEMPSNKKPYGIDLLRPVDSRLNFDWCKYNPPPWAETDDNEVAKVDNVASNCSCSCEFCRSRIWAHICKVCRTPL